VSQFVQPSTVLPALPMCWMVIPVTVAVRPVGPMPISSPSCVPWAFHLVATLSPSTI
jgi:hypothetical protein